MAEKAGNCLVVKSKGFSMGKLTAFTEMPFGFVTTEPLRGLAIPIINLLMFVEFKSETNTFTYIVLEPDNHSGKEVWDM